MAVRFSGSGQQLSNNAGLPVTRLFTISCWVYPITYSGAAQIFWSLDSSSSQYATLGYDTTGKAIFNWAGGGARNTLGEALTLGDWNFITIVVNGVSASMYQSVPGFLSAGLSSAYVQTGNFTLPTGALTLSIGGSANFLTSWPNVRIASFKMWDAALGSADIFREYVTYVPQRTANLSRWHPLLQTEGTDYSGNGRSLSSAGSTTEPGPPIPWRTSGSVSPLIPWTPGAPVWYAVYRISDGSLFSGDWSYNITLPLPDGMGYKTYLTQPDQTKVVWDPSVLDFISLEGKPYSDRVTDIVTDPSCSAAWATLSAPNSLAIQNRIGQLLGPWRYRWTYQDIDLQGTSGQEQIP